MKKIVGAVLLITTGLLFWFFTTNNEGSRISFIPSTYYKKIGGDSRNHVPSVDFSQLKDKQASTELKDIVDSLGAETFRFEDKVITLENGSYIGKMNDKRVIFRFSDIFFSPSDKTGKEATVLIMAYQEKGKREIAYYLFTWLPEGTLSTGSFIGNDVHVHTVALKNGIITLGQHLANEDPVEDVQFALTKQKKGTIPSIEPLPKTLVTK